jgi:glycosyltransferase involved in cell wall biosynthesis
MPKPTRVLLFATHHNSSNGYSNVAYELTKQLAKRSDIQLTVFGFQNFSQIPNHRTDFPKNVFVYDAWANEEPKAAGFGVTLVKEFVTANRPDVCIVYNDMLVLTSIISQLAEVPNKKFKIIAYIDQVYLCQKKEYINFVNKHADVAMLFTPFWENCIKEQGVTVPTCHLPHGFNMQAHYPIPKTLARKFFGLKNDDFIILNLNRNQPRKRWDICIQAFADICQKLPDEPIKLLIATAVQGAWNILEIFERELIKRGLTLQDGMKHLILLDNPQQLSDEDVTFLYNTADIGINTCDGEGFGLCNFEQAAIGIPQIVPNIGGFKDFFNEDNAILINPVMTYYVDNSRDMVCGEAELCNYKDFAAAIEKYYYDRELVKKHGINSRQKICSEYKWEKFGNQLYDYIKDAAKDLATITEEDEEEAEDAEDEEININNLTEMIQQADKTETPIKTKTNKTKDLPDVIPITPLKKKEKEVVKEPVKEVKEKQEPKEEPVKVKSSTKSTSSSSKKSTKDRLKEKLKARSSKKDDTKKDDMDQIMDLKSKLDALLAKTTSVV